MSVAGQFARPAAPFAGSFRLILFLYLLMAFIGI